MYATEVHQRQKRNEPMEKNTKKKRFVITSIQPEKTVGMLVFVVNLRV